VARPALPRGVGARSVRRAMRWECAASM